MYPNLIPAGSVFTIASADPVAASYAGKVYQTLFGNDKGIIARPQVGTLESCVFVPLDGSFTLSPMNVPNLTFIPYTQGTQITDLGILNGSPNTWDLGVFYPPLFAGAQPAQTQAPAAQPAVTQPLPVAPVAQPVGAAQPAPEPIPVPEEVFQPGAVWSIESTTNPAIGDYVQAIFRTELAEQGTGVLATPHEANNIQGMVFFPDDGSTVFELLPSESELPYRFKQPMRQTSVHDLGFIGQSGEHKPLSEFAQGFFGSPPPPQPAGQPDTNYAKDFPRGRVFMLTQSDNPNLQGYVDDQVAFQVEHADETGVLAKPEINSGIDHVVFLPFDGQTDFEVNLPQGKYQFEGTIYTGTPVYNSSTDTYVVVDTFMPMMYDDYVYPYFYTTPVVCDFWF